MTPLVGVYIIVGTLIVIAIIFLIGMRGRGKPIQCPECGETFKRPAMPEKASGIGYSLPGIGDFTCPKCGYRGRTGSFRNVGPEDAQKESGKS